MNPRALALSAAVMFPAGVTLFGGWAVVTIENPPERLTVGVAHTLEYTVRQHGVELVNDLSGRIEATSAGRTVRATAKPAGKKGRYAATLTLPSEGAWTITVHSGFGPAKTTMLPISASVPGASQVALSPIQRGEQLFAAKGCATCHVEMKVIPTDVRNGNYDEQFVKKLLADPKSMPKRHAAAGEMPNLNLAPAEIAALASYLAGPNSTGTR